MEQPLITPTLAPTVLVLTSDPDLADRLGAALAPHGLMLEHHETPASLLSGIRPGMPGLLLIDSRLLPDHQAIAALSIQVQERRGQPLPLAGLVAGADIQQRLAMLRAGACACLDRSLDPALLAERLVDLTEPTRATADRVLVVDDQPVAALFASRVLEAAGMQTARVTDPLAVLEVLESFAPDLVLMDLHMPGASGIELTRIIREQDRFADLPIIFLSAELDAEQQMTALRVGGDDFLAKPVTPQRLRAAVSECLRIARERAARQAGAIDPRTGLASLSRLLQRVTQLIRRGGAELECRALVAIEQVGSEEALAHLVDVLRAQLQARDLAARVGERTLAVLVREDRAEHLGAVCDGLSQGLFAAAPDLVMGVGWCRLARGGGDAVTLLSRAGKAARASLRRGDRRLGSYPRAPSRHPAGSAPSTVVAISAEHLRLLFAPMVGVTQQPRARYEVTPRLVSGDGELLTPNQIVPLARRAGTLDQLDQWILTAGLEVLRSACANGCPVQLFLHQSLESVQQDRWVERVRDEINARDLFRVRPVIQFQLQELVEEPRLAATRMRHLGRLGIQVCLNGLDDRPAVIAALATIPASFARLTSDMVQALDPESLSALIQTARGHGLKVIAAGVETPETIARLCRAGVDLLQGPFVQPPGIDMDYDFGGLAADEDPA
ncbi:MAG: EAL domain-containing protein [Sphingobacteriia bacterium]|nr:EAL domain-containing protein [Sphingobacteriia bacterium]NCC38266.1 EAL domain-containing protein [Gammaproteobacteria bacterium]